MKITTSILRGHIACITIENNYLKARFLPEFGGHLYTLKAKETGRDLIEPAGLPTKTKSLSGGASFHTAAKDVPAFFAEVTAGETTHFLRMYNYTADQLLWQVDFHLPDDARMLYAYTTITNDRSVPNTFHCQAETCLPQSTDTIPGVISSDAFQAVLSSDGFLCYERFGYNDFSSIKLNAESSISTLQTFGYLELEPDESLQSTPAILQPLISNLIRNVLPDAFLKEQENYFHQYCHIPGQKLLHLGTGDGAYEQINRMLYNRPLFPRQFIFPAESLTEDQYPFIHDLL